MAIGSALGLVANRLIEPVEGMHRAVFDRVSSLVGPAVAPVAVVHDAVSRTVYGSLRLGTRVLGRGLDATPLSRTTLSEDAAAVVNGFYGDDPGPFERGLRSPMGLRTADGVELRFEGLSDAYPEAGPRVAILVHGLAETERCWRDRPEAPGLRSAIDRTTGASALAVRYNSGLRISDNGAALSELVDQLCSNWPVAIESITLIGHSMGGLVLRSAVLEAVESGRAWTGVLERIVTLGTPHGGAPMEKFVNVLAWGLSKVPESRPLARLLNRRSVGVKDLRFGAVSPSDWAGFDADALLTDTVGAHAVPPGVAVHFVAGVVTDDPAHPVGIVAGDLLVRQKSAGGGGKLEPDDLRVLGGLHHFDLLHHPEVITQVTSWIDGDRPPA